MIRSTILSLAFFLTLVSSGCRADSVVPVDQSAPDSLRYGSPQRIGTVIDTRCAELSGLAASRLRFGLLWAHNDSGDEPRLFALDTTGRTRAVVTMDNAEALDWEDLASVRLGGRSWLYVGDIGDNLKSREFITVYRVEEPVLPADTGVALLHITAEAAQFRYPGNPANCEALMVHPETGDLYFVTKTEATTCEVYSASWPRTAGRTTTLTLKATLALPFDQGIARLVTAGDISPDGRSCILRTYLGALEYRLEPGLPFSSIWHQTPRMVPMPMVIQAEAICYNPDGKRIFTTTETLPAPIHVIDILR